MFKFIFFLLVALFEAGDISPSVVHAEDSSVDLEKSLFKERLRKAFVASIKKVPVEWQVSALGKVENWKYFDSSMHCRKNSEVRCADYTPLSLSLINGKRDWVDSVEVLSKVEPVVISESNLSVNDDGKSSKDNEPEELSDSGANSNKQFRLKDGRRAWEVWDVSVLLNSSRSKLRIYLSLKSGLMEKLEYGDGVEELDWLKLDSKEYAEISRIRMQRNQNLVSFSKAK